MSSHVVSAPMSFSILAQKYAYPKKAVQHLWVWSDTPSWQWEWSESDNYQDRTGYLNTRGHPPGHVCLKQSDALPGFVASFMSSMAQTKLFPDMPMTISNIECNCFAKHPWGAKYIYILYINIYSYLLKSICVKITEKKQKMQDEARQCEARRLPGKKVSLGFVKIVYQKW